MIFKKNWDKLKKTDKAFPKDKISIVEIKSEEGSFNSAWVNTGYKNYAFKENCPILGVLNIGSEDLNEMHPQEIQEYFRIEFNKVCVSHLISRIPSTDGGIELLFYFEDKDMILDKANEIYESEDKLVDFGISLQEDKNWNTIENMMERFSQ